MHGAGPLSTLLVLGLIILVGAAALALYQTRSTHFECPTCGRSFKVSVFEYFFATHAPTGRYVTCPYCFTGAMLTPIPD
jgi:hypothetical protein